MISFAALPTKEVAIDGFNCKLTMLPTGESRPLFFKLVKICGPGVIAGLKAFSDSNAEQEAKVAKVSDAIGELVGRLDYEDFETFVQKFAEQTEILGKDGSNVLLKAQLSRNAFDGNYGTLVKWLGVCLEFNFASFLSAWGIISPRA